MIQINSLSYFYIIYIQLFLEPVDSTVEKRAFLTFLTFIFTALEDSIENLYEKGLILFITCPKIINRSQMYLEPFFKPVQTISLYRLYDFFSLKYKKLETIYPASRIYPKHTIILQNFKLSEIL